jgi:hypothetical protein
MDTHYKYCPTKNYMDTHYKYCPTTLDIRLNYDGCLRNLMMGVCVIYKCFELNKPRVTYQIPD